MQESKLLMIPGPTPVPDDILRAMSAPMINHRGPQFKGIIERVTAGVKDVFQTEQTVLIFPSSGSGVMESAVANMVSPGDKVLALSIGAFGNRFAKIASIFGADVEKKEFEWGKPVDPAWVADRLAQDKTRDIKAILVTHNETSTGVLNDIAAIAKARGSHPALLIVDTVSGLAAMDFQFDAWGIDVAVAGSQKAFMLPPGLGFVALNERAWAANAKATAPRFYWDYKLAKEFLEKGQTPVTPPVALYFALDKALEMMAAEGLSNIQTRHLRLRDEVRAGARALGFDLLAIDSAASSAVTAIRAPQGIHPKTISKTMREQFQIVIAAGQAQLEEVIFRIGHLGAVDDIDILTTMGALEMTLNILGVPVAYGSATSAVQKIIMERRVKA